MTFNFPTFVTSKRLRNLFLLSPLLYFLRMSEIPVSVLSVRSFWAVINSPWVQSQATHSTQIPTETPSSLVSPLKFLLRITLVFWKITTATSQQNGRSQIYGGIFTNISYTINSDEEFCKVFRKIQFIKSTSARDAFHS